MKPQIVLLNQMCVSGLAFQRVQKTLQRAGQRRAEKERITCAWMPQAEFLRMKKLPAELPNGRSYFRVANSLVTTTAIDFVADHGMLHHGPDEQFLIVLPG